MAHGGAYRWNSRKINRTPSWSWEWGRSRGSLLKSMTIRVEGSRSLAPSPALPHTISLSLSLSFPRGTVSSRSRSDRPETIPHAGLRRLTRHTALRMTCGRWTNAIGSKGAPAFPPPYAPPSILVRLKRRFQSSYSGRAHAHAFAASTAAPRWAAPPGVCVCAIRPIRPEIPHGRPLDRALAIFTLDFPPSASSRDRDLFPTLLFDFLFHPDSSLGPRILQLFHPPNSPPKKACDNPSRKCQG